MSLALIPISSIAHIDDFGVEISRIDSRGDDRGSHDAVVVASFVAADKESPGMMIGCNSCQLSTEAWLTTVGGGKIRSLGHPRRLSQSFWELEWQHVFMTS